MKIVFVILACTTLNCPVFSQIDNSQVACELKKLSETYKAKPSLSFHISYYYADEQTPAIYLDSLKGSFKLHGNHFWYELNETEAMSGDNYIVMLFKEDQIMYLAKPGSEAKGLNPLSSLDSFVIDTNNVKGSIQEYQYERKISLSFTPGSKYKTIEYFISKETGLINRMINVVESGALFDENVQPLTNTNSSYAIVEIILSEYQTTEPAEKDFNTNRYFKKEGSDYVPVPPYESYKIFLGSPNL